MPVKIHSTGLISASMGAPHNTKSGKSCTLIPHFGTTASMEAMSVPKADFQLTLMLLIRKQ